MDCRKTGSLLCMLRREKGLTQQEVGDAVHVSDKTVSKWECGAGCPDVTLLPVLSNFFNVPVEDILRGEISENMEQGGNMKKSCYYICPQCGNVIMSASDVSVSCCGRKLSLLVAQKKSAENALQIEDIDGEWFVSSDHEMTKEHYISFVAFAIAGSVTIVRLYPEWNVQLRFPKIGHGILLWYCTRDGLFSQLI